MKKIKTKLWAGMGIIFLITLLVLFINIGSNQNITQKSSSILIDNYTSVKYAVNMLQILDEMNTLFLLDNYNVSKSNQAGVKEGRFSLLKEAFEQKLEQQNNNITEVGEQKITESLVSDYQNYVGYIQDQPFDKVDYNIYKTLYQNLRKSITDIYDINIIVLEQKNNEIQTSARHVMNLQKNVGIAYLTIMCLLILLLPFLLINPIEKLAARIKEFYREHFNKEITVREDNEIAMLSELFDKVVYELKGEKKDWISD